MSIAHLSVEDLELFGYAMVIENEEFRVFNHVYTGEDQIVDKNNPLLLVEDLNDALAMRATRVTVVPDDDC